MQHEPEKFAVSNADEPEMKLLKKARQIVVVWKHDDYHGRFWNEYAGGNQEVFKIINKDRVQGSVLKMPIRMDRWHRKAVQIFHLKQEGEEHGESLCSADGWDIPAATDALNSPNTPRGFD